MSILDKGPFTGVRIIDFTSYFTGPYATGLLADQGAEVIKVEATPTGDLMRQFGTARGGKAATFETVNHSKRSIALNLKEPKGAEIARQLIATADVIVENFRPGVAERLGLDYESCRKLRDDIICLSISGYGDEGPYGGMPAFDIVIQGHSGIAYGQGADDTPDFVRQAIVDKVTALYASQAISAALFGRERGGGGEHIKLSMYDAALAFHWPDGMNEFTFLDGEVRTAPPAGSLYRMQKTKDGFVAVSPITNAQFAGFCRAVERDEMINDPRVDDLQKRVEQREIILDIRASCEKFTTEELCRRFLKEDVPHGPILKRADVLSDPQFAHAHVKEYGEAGERTRIAGSPSRWKYSGEQEPYPAPNAGEHSEQILTELGLSAQEILDVISSGAVASSVKR